MLLEANVDDATGETLAHAVAALLDAGAHDAWVTPIVMKKGRPAHTVSALADPALAGQIADVLTARDRLARRARPDARALAVGRDRRSEVDVEGYPVRVKVSAGRVKVEHDDAARAAERLHLPLREVRLAGRGGVAPRGPLAPHLGAATRRRRGMTYDAVVVGAGPNGLAAAVTIARAGRSVLVVEAADRVGGGATSAELTLPGVTHDVCSAVHPLAATSPFLRSLPLADHGLDVGLSRHRPRASLRRRNRGVPVSIARSHGAIARRRR